MTFDHLRLSNTLFAKFEENKRYFIAITYASISHSKEESSSSIAYWSSDFRTEAIVSSRSVSICGVQLKDRSRFRENRSCYRVVSCIVDRENCLKERSDSGNDTVT